MCRVTVVNAVVLPKLDRRRIKQLILLARGTVVLSLSDQVWVQRLKERPGPRLKLWRRMGSRYVSKMAQGPIMKGGRKRPAHLAGVLLGRRRVELVRIRFASDERGVLAANSAAEAVAETALGVSSNPRLELRVHVDRQQGRRLSVAGTHGALVEGDRLHTADLFELLRHR